MTRLIDADALIKAINKFPYGYRGMIESEIENQPTVDAVPVRHGKWITKEIMVHNYYVITGFKCSVCGEDALDDDAEPMTDYCPHCGARMDVDD